MAKANPFRFSTKYQDDETELLYYGYRYYAPSTGRWLSKDPKGEIGGISLYAFVINNPMLRVDRLGLDNPVLGLGGSWPADPYAPGGAYWIPPRPTPISPTARLIIFKVSAALQCVGGGLEAVGGVALAGGGGVAEVGTIGVSTPVSAVAVIGGGVLFVNGGDNLITGAKKLIFSVDAQTATEQVVSAGLQKTGIPPSAANSIASGFNSGLMISGGFYGGKPLCCGKPKIELTVELKPTEFPKPYFPDPPIPPSEYFRDLEIAFEMAEAQWTRLHPGVPPDFEWICNTAENEMMELGWPPTGYE